MHLDLDLSALADRARRAVMPRVLLCGYYGFGNFGDEALLEVIVQRLRDRFPAVSLEVLSATPQATTADHRVAAIPRWDRREVRAAIARADLVLSGGGGLLQNATSTRSLLYYAGIVREAVRARRKTMLFAQSIGPLDFWGRLIVRNFCRGVERATVRDERSRRLVESLLPETPVEKTADPVFLYGSAETADLSGEGLGPE
ncbi:MAG: polysaccharide pyruvyl transferase family protein, partial [Candidatus Eremiobacteraeota bacterium]|nr:polysaccharide pyruvyl transferase family protein [Candidatus Eremiobacteraeota bacterium]